MMGSDNRHRELIHTLGYGVSVATVAWLHIFGKIATWEFYLYTFIAFLIIGLATHITSLTTTFSSYFSLATFFPSIALFLAQPPYPAPAPAWWIVNPWLQWTAVLGAYIVGCMFFSGQSSSLRTAPMVPPEPPRTRKVRGMHSIGLTVLVAMSFILTSAVYPTLKDLGAYADVVLHLQGIAELPSSPSLFHIAGYSIPYALHRAFPSLPLGHIFWMLQGLFRAAYSIGVFLLFRRWLGASSALLGSIIASMLPLLLVVFPQAFLLNFGLAFLPIFLWGITEPKWTKTAACAALITAAVLMLSDVWFIGYLLLSITLWSLFAGWKRTARGMDLLLMGCVGILSVVILLATTIKRVSLVPAQASIFRSFPSADYYVPAMTFLLTSGVVLILWLFERKLMLSHLGGRSLGVGLLLLSFFVLSQDFGFIPLLSISAWAIYASSTSTHRRFHELQRHEQLFWFLIAFSILPTVFKYSGVTIGSVGFGVMAIIPFTYFACQGIAQLHRTHTAQLRRSVVALVAVIAMGMYTLFSYISRFLFSQLTDSPLFLNRTLLLLALCMLGVIMVWRLQHRNATIAGAQ